MIEIATEETNGSDRVPDLKPLRCEPGLERHFFRYREMALLFECRRLLSSVQKYDNGYPDLFEWLKTNTDINVPRWSSAQREKLLDENTRP